MDYNYPTKTKTEFWLYSENTENEPNSLKREKNANTPV